MVVSVWKNRLCASVRGVGEWVQRHDHGLVRLGYPEFKGIFSTSGGSSWRPRGSITVFVESDDTFVQVLTPRLHQESPDEDCVSLPQAGLAFLHAIPP